MGALPSFEGVSDFSAPQELMEGFTLCPASRLGRPCLPRVGGGALLSSLMGPWKRRPGLGEPGFGVRGLGCLAGPRRGELLLPWGVG